MIPALAFLTFVGLAIGITARLIWLDTRRRARRPEVTELGFDEDAGDLRLAEVEREMGATR